MIFACAITGSLGYSSTKKHVGHHYEVHTVANVGIGFLKRRRLGIALEDAGLVIFRQRKLALLEIMLQKDLRQVLHLQGGATRSRLAIIFQL